MYKGLVPSHLDYCDIIYHIPSVQTQLGVILINQMEKQPKQLLLLLVHGKVQVVPNFMKNLDGNPYLNVVGVGAFCRYIRLSVTRHLFILKDKLPRHRRP